ncbi:MAG TPA: hypothetical protein VHO69_05040 [Phototrophicaceae bacterium]|nr:hypothetical protein [Phototrophicaceae bacterium]
MKRFDYDFLTSKLKDSVLVYTEIPHEEVTRLGEKAASEYISPEHSAAWFWRMQSGFGSRIYGKDGWFWLRDYLQGQETVLFFSPLSAQPGFRFADGSKLIQFLKGIRYFREFYLTNSRGEFLIFNFHEEITYGTGLAETWIDEEHHKF